MTWQILDPVRTAVDPEPSVANDRFRAGQFAPAPKFLEPSTT
jgi:hypothetical protein